MEKPYILHMFAPTRHVSPFDVNMACDAGYDVVVPYPDVGLDDIASLTQDAIFSRGPKGARRTGLYIGGRDIALAAQMLDAVRKAMVPPFEVSAFVDPSGAFTTAAAMVACVERQLATTRPDKLAGADVVVLGGTGPVGAAAAVLASDAGARAALGSRRVDHARQVADAINARYGTHIGVVQTNVDDARPEWLRNAEVVLATGKAGVALLQASQLANASKLLVAADVNAVPPAGIEGVGAMDDGKPLDAASGRAVGIGALAVGNVKYQTQRSMLESMRTSGKAVYLALREAFATAREQTT